METIGINTLFLIPNRVGGTEYYTRSFLKHLEKKDKRNLYTIFCNKENFNTFDFTSKNWKKVLCPINASNRFTRILYEQIVFPFVVWINKCDVLHSFGYFGPVLGKFKKIVTVHDANWKDCPDDVSPFQIFVMNILISSNIFVANKIITDSKFSKSRLVHYFPNQKRKIIVIPGAVEDDFIKLLKKNSRPVVDGKYLLCVSKFYPHKKIPYLVSLFKEIEKKDINLKLVLVGRDGYDEKLVMDKIKGDKRILHFDKVKYPDLVNLYKYAGALVFPSIYEGFAYPVYEAAAAGIPIFVGKNNLYPPKAQGKIKQLSFDDSDVSKVINGLGVKTSSTFFPSYEASIKKLVASYSSLLK